MESAMWVNVFLPVAGWLRCQQILVTPSLITISRSVHPHDDPPHFYSAVYTS